MTQPTDFERLLASWMEADGPHDVPRRVVDAALHEARGVDQRGDLTSALPCWLPLGPVPAASLARQRGRRVHRLSHGTARGRPDHGARCRCGVRRQPAPPVVAEPCRPSLPRSVLPDGIAQ